MSNTEIAAEETGLINTPKDMKVIINREHPNFPNGKQIVVAFDNGYGASIITGDGAYQSTGTYELAVLKMKNDNLDWDLCYSTGITDDVIADQSNKEISELLKRISKCN